MALVRISLIQQPPSVPISAVNLCGWPSGSSVLRLDNPAKGNCVLLLYAQFLPERLETTHQNLTAFQTPQMCWKIHGVQLWECSKSKALETVWEGHTPPCSGWTDYPESSFWDCWARLQTSGCSWTADPESNVGDCPAKRKSVRLWLNRQPKRQT